MSMPEPAAPPRRRLLTARRLVPALMILIVGVLVLAPLLRILMATLTPSGLEAWGAILASPMSPRSMSRSSAGGSPAGSRRWRSRLSDPSWMCG